MNTLSNYVTIRPLDIVPAATNIGVFAINFAVSAIVNMFVQSALQGPTENSEYTDMTAVIGGLVGLSVSAFLGSYIPIKSFTVRKTAEFAASSIVLGSLFGCVRGKGAAIGAIAVLIIPTLGALIGAGGFAASVTLPAALGSFGISILAIKAATQKT